MLILPQYERTHMESKRMLPGYFFYYCRIPVGANYMSLGVGTESKEGLIINHQEVAQIHRAHVQGMAMQIGRTGINMRNGPLVQRLFGDEETYRKEYNVGSHRNERELSGLTLISEELSELMLKLYDDIWGATDIHINIQNGGDAQAMIYYDETTRTIVVGSAYGGFFREASRFTRHQALKVAAALYSGNAELILYPPANERARQAIALSFREHQEIAVAIVRLADSLNPSI